VDRLLQPDIGLIVCTAITFLALVAVLGKFAWRPLLAALKSREDGIRRAIEDAQSARSTADKLKAQYEQELAKAQDKAAQMLAQAQAESQKLREQMLKDTDAESRRLKEQTQRQLEEEKSRISRELRQEVAGLSVRVAEKLLRHSVDRKENEALVKGFMQDLDKGTP
jgi:F-type H+-transporting ATPase subunit b